MLHIPNASLQETRFYKDVFNEGWGEGRGKGRVEGRVEGESRLILRQMTKRLGPVPATIQTRVRQLTLEQMETLGEALLDFQDLDDLRRWLDGQ